MRYFVGCPFDRLRDRGGRGAGTAWEGAQGPRRGIAGAEHVEAQGARKGRDLLDGHKKEARGVEPRASDDYYCSAGLSVSIGQ